MKLFTIAGAGLAALALVACHPADRPVEDTARPSEQARATNDLARNDASAIPPISTDAESATASGATAPASATAAAAAGTVTLTPTGFEMGDLFHVNATVNGESGDYTVRGGPNDPLLAFLIAHRGQPLQATVTRAAEDATDEQGLPQQDVITGATLNGQTPQQWWSGLNAADRTRWSRAAECAMIPVGQGSATDNCPALR